MSATVLSGLLTTFSPDSGIKIQMKENLHFHYAPRAVFFDKKTTMFIGGHCADT
jgi:hypothetical protein